MLNEKKAWFITKLFIFMRFKEPSQSLQDLNLGTFLWKKVL
jgi:hypothetical protein